MNTVLNFVIDVTLQQVVGTIVGLIIAYVAQQLWKKHQFAGWVVKVIKPAGELGCSRPIGMKKAEEIMDDETTLSVYLKGLVSPFGWLVIDLVTEGISMGVLSIDKVHKLITVDLSVKGAVKETKNG